MGAACLLLRWLVADAFKWSSDANSADDDDNSNGDAGGAHVLALAVALALLQLHVFGVVLLPAAVLNAARGHMHTAVLAVTCLLSAWHSSTACTCVRH